MLRNMVFDMGGVLLTYDPQRFASQFTDNPADSALLATVLFLSPLWQQADQGLLTDDDLLSAAKKELPPRLHEAATLTVRYWHRGMLPIPGMEALLYELKEKSYALYLLSNASYSFFRYSPDFPFFDLFDGKLISCVERLIKPNPEIFVRLTKKFSIPFETCFFIDDFENNIRVASSLGMRGCRFDGSTERLREALKKEGIL